MIIKVGNQSFDSRRIPIALVLDDQDLMQIGGIPPKGDSQQDPRSLYVRCPVDLPPATLLAWLREAVTEMPLPTVYAAYNPGKKLEDQP